MARSVLLSGAAALVLVACGGGEEKAAAPPPPPAVEAVRVAGADGLSQISATGRIERRREVALSFRVPGVMTSLTVEAGDPVRAGQVVATLDPTGVAASESRASADLERARRDLARDRALFEKGYVSRQRVDDRASAVKSAEAGMTQAAFDRRWARMVSPVSGVVLERLGQSGQVVQPGQTVIRVADERTPLVLRAPVADREVAAIRPGASATVRVSGLPDIFGRVTRIGQSAGARTGAVDVEVELPAAAGLRSGQIGAVTFMGVTAGTPAGAIRLPAEAILEAEGRRAFVLVVDQSSTARRRPVSFEGFDGDFARVGGLSPGQQVITAGAGFVSDGEKVRVVDPTRLEAAKGPARP